MEQEEHSESSIILILSLDRQGAKDSCYLSSLMLIYWLSKRVLASATSGISSNEERCFRKGMILRSYLSFSLL